MRGLLPPSLVIVPIVQGNANVLVRLCGSSGVCSLVRGLHGWQMSRRWCAVPPPGHWLFTKGGWNCAELLLLGVCDGFSDNAASFADGGCAADIVEPK
ncbi:hypothetical protein CCHOA_06770 [Corynebacterium choanae]|uniref:Uncharacterized protein n=1 Tax=Corynebacterium choanae TaxID=1862358 RepID=A0A3G6J6Z5_9CORY|nr:hypothetical protein CCHOA_06770 [Corynebacterium choanae]